MVASTANIWSPLPGYSPRVTKSESAPIDSEGKPNDIWIWEKSSDEVLLYTRLESNVWSAPTNLAAEGTLRTDLADPTPTKGADLVAYSADGTTATSQSVMQWMRQQAVNALDHFTDTERTNVLMRTGALDVSAALQRASDYAIANGKSLFLPAGLYTIVANNGFTTGWKLEAPDNFACFVFGEGESTVIKRMDTATLSGAATMIILRANTGAFYHLSNMLTDGNEQNCPIGDGSGVEEVTANGTDLVYDLGPVKPDGGVAITRPGETPILVTQEIGRRVTTEGQVTLETIDPLPAGTLIQYYNTFAQEQCANVKWNPGTGVPRGAALVDFVGTNPVGDVYQTNVQNDYLTVTRFTATTRTRRPRGDIQLSRIPRICTNISDSVMVTLETEPSVVAAGHIINISNVHTNNLDLAGDVSVNTGYLNVNAVNLEVKSEPGKGVRLVNLYQLRGSFVNCLITKIRRIQRCELTFVNCENRFITAYNDPNTVDTAEIWVDGLFHDLKFVGGKTTAPSSVSEGTYYQIQTAQNNRAKITEFVDHDVTVPAAIFISANRHGRLILDGGKLRSDVIAFIAHGGGTFVADLMVKNPDQWVASNALVEIGSVGAAGQQIFDISGQIDGDTQQFVSVPSAANNITWRNSLIAHMSSTPVGSLRGVPGLTVRLKTQPPATAIEYRYANTAASGSNTAYFASVTTP